MRVYEGRRTREEYLQSQIQRSSPKFRFCKVSAHDVRKYRHVIVRHAGERGVRQALLGPMLCLGTRNGREIDLFRTEFFGSRARRFAVRWAETLGPFAFQSRLPWLESRGRSSLARLTPESVWGVELNPMGARQDVWTGSFDELPAEWAGKFGIVYSNSFDHSEDPERTIREWKHMVRPGGYLILCYVRKQQVSHSDPVGELTAEDVLGLLREELVYFQDGGSCNNYSEAIICLPRTPKGAVNGS